MPLPNIERTTFVTITIFPIYLVMKTWPVLHLLSLLPLLPVLVPLPNHHILTTQILAPHLGPFRRSKPPFAHMLLLSMPLFVNLSKSGMISSEGWLLHRTNTSRTLVHVFKLGVIGISLNPTHHHPHLLHHPSRWSSSPFASSLLCPRFASGTMPYLSMGEWCFCVSVVW